MIDIKQIIYFHEIVKHNGMTRAAEHLYISQSTLSKSMKDLESSLDAQLFHRDHRKLALTDIGQIFLETSQKILDLYQQLPDEINQLKAQRTGHIRIGLSSMIDMKKFVKTLRRYHEAYPHVTYNLIENGGKYIEAELLNNELEIGLTSLPVDHHLFDHIPLYKEHFHIVMHKHHPLAQSSSVALIDLQHEDFIIFNEDYYANDMIVNTCRQAGFVPNIISHISQWNIIQYLIDAEIGVSILPDSIISSLTPSEIKTFPIDEAVLSWEIGLIWKKNSYLNHVTKTWIDYIAVELP